MPLTKAEHAAALTRMRRYPKNVPPDRWGTGPLRTLDKIPVWAPKIARDTLRRYG